MSNTNLPEQAQIVIIGGGIAGCSIAYHLAKRGVTDVVVLERQQLTSGTTWHAAGLVSMLWPTPTLTRLARYSHELYASLEEETGQATGYRRTGSLSLARDEERLEELMRTASMAAAFDVESRSLTNDELEDMYPGINTEGVIGSLFIPSDGQTNPIDTTMALARGARMRGAKVIEGVQVDEILTENGAAVGVRTSQGEIKADKVVLAGGLWSRDVAAKIGVDLPLYACEHFYVVTEPMEGLTKRPVLRDFSKGVYYKEDAGKMLVGWFEGHAKACPMENIAEDFCFGEFPFDMDHIEDYLMDSIETFPPFGEAGINTFFNGPESFTPDNLHLLGPTPEVDNFWVACGMNSKGIGAGGGMGMIMADWIIDGYPSGDILECDVRRFQPVQRTQSYVEARIPEALGHTYAMHWPFYQYHTARDQRQSPLYDLLKEQGACFGEVGGFERANWFATDGSAPEYEYSYKRANWFPFFEAEHKAVRERVGLIDMSSFGKFEVTGKDALATLQYVCAADVDVPVGELVYTQWLNAQGGIEADLTVARMADEQFFVMTGVASTYRDFWHLKKHLIGDTQLKDATMDYGCISIQGPNARAVLEQVTDTDVSNAGFAFGSGRFCQVEGIDLWMQRLSYTGELGWELFMPTANAVTVYEALQQAGAAHGIANVGLHALNSLRLEKGFRHWGHDVGPEDNLVQAGLSFVAKPDAKDFLGKEAFVAQKAAGLPDRRLLQFKLDDPAPMLYHNEPVLMDGEYVGYLVSGMYGHTVGGALGMGYVSVAGLSKDRIEGAVFEVEVARERFAAKASLRGFYDPAGERMRG